MDKQDLMPYYVGKKTIKLIVQFSDLIKPRFYTCTILDLDDENVTVLDKNNARVILNLTKILSVEEKVNNDPSG